MTETQIVNRALLRVGHTKIADINDTNDFKSVVAKELYEEARDATLRSVHWGACKVWSDALSEMGDNPASDEWAHAYQLPTDPFCLRVRRIAAGIHVDRGHYRHPTEVACEISYPRMLLCQDSPVKIVYTGRIVDTTMWDANLQRAVALLLAADFATALAKDGKLANEILKEWEATYVMATGVDESESGRDEYTNTDLLSVR